MKTSKDKAVRDEPAVKGRGGSASARTTTSKGANVQPEHRPTDTAKEQEVTPRDDTASMSKQSTPRTLAQSQKTGGTASASTTTGPADEAKVQEVTPGEHTASMSKQRAPKDLGKDEKSKKRKEKQSILREEGATKKPKEGRSLLPLPPMPSPKFHSQEDLGRMLDSIDRMKQMRESRLASSIPRIGKFTATTWDSGMEEAMHGCPENIRATVVKGLVSEGGRRVVIERRENMATVLLRNKNDKDNDPLIFHFPAIDIIGKEAARGELLTSIFSFLNKSKCGFLSEQELRVYGEANGFSGPDAAWHSEYAYCCKGLGCDGFGIHLEGWRLLLSDSSETGPGRYWDLAELNMLLEVLMARRDAEESDHSGSGSCVSADSKVEVDKETKIDL